VYLIITQLLIAPERGQSNTDGCGASPPTGQRSPQTSGWLILISAKPATRMVKPMRVPNTLGTYSTCPWRARNTVSKTALARVSWAIGWRDEAATGTASAPRRPEPEAGQYPQMSLEPTSRLAAGENAPSENG
jgi:hypothetical protein